MPYTKTFEGQDTITKPFADFLMTQILRENCLKNSGYPMGLGLPAFNLEINSGGGERNLMVALAVQKMLKENLGIM